MKPSKLRTFNRLYPLHGIDPALEKPDWQKIFPQCSRLEIEIGIGSGEAAIEHAAASPHVGLLGFEVYAPGLASALAGIEKAGLRNFKVVQADVRLLLAGWFAPGSLDGVRIFFPDPWPKKRHHKRRLVNPLFLEQVRSRLKESGRLHFATDWQDYAEEVQEMLESAPGWRIVAAGAGADARSGRPATRFERRGLAEGRASHDLVAELEKEASA